MFFVYIFQNVFDTDGLKNRIEITEESLREREIDNISIDKIAQFESFHQAEMFIQKNFKVEHAGYFDTDSTYNLYQHVTNDEVLFLRKKFNL